MSYTKQNWEDYPDTSTPITADALNHMEDGIFNAVVVSPTTPPDGTQLWIKTGINGTDWAFLFEDGS